MGADLYLTKPYDLDGLLKTIKEMLSTGESVLTVRFWGTRGSIPTPGRSTLRYGGNTACVEIRAGENILLFDCGSGVREAGLALMRESEGRPIRVHLFVSHTHWDHIQGFPFFVPAYVPGNQASIYSLRGSDKSLEKIFTGQMDTNYFPVDLSAMLAQLQFVELDGTVEIGDGTESEMWSGALCWAASLRAWSIPSRRRLATGVTIANSSSSASLLRLQNRVPSGNH